MSDTVDDLEAAEEQAGAAVAALVGLLASDPATTEGRAAAANARSTIATWGRYCRPSCEAEGGWAECRVGEIGMCGCPCHPRYDEAIDTLADPPAPFLMGPGAAGVAEAAAEQGRQEVEAARRQAEALAEQRRRAEAQARAMAAEREAEEGRKAAAIGAVIGRLASVRDAQVRGLFAATAADLAHHLTEDDDPCQDRGVAWPCDVAEAFGCGAVGPAVDPFEGGDGSEVGPAGGTATFWATVEEAIGLPPPRPRARCPHGRLVGAPCAGCEAEPMVRGQ